MTTKIYSFFDDYSEGAHQEILKAIVNANQNQESGYGNDSWSKLATERILKALGKNAGVHFISGGTQTNLIALQSMLLPYQGIIAPESGHINVHEAGAIEATGRKIITIKTPDGKLTPKHIDEALSTHNDEHTVMPKVVFITQTTELGTVYALKELQELVSYAHKKDLYAYIDGARLSVACAATEMSLSDIAETGVDMMYIGGTKVGALCGEALVIFNNDLKKDFRYHLKQRGALLAKGRLIGSQFARLFEADNLWLELGKLSNEKAQKLYLGLSDLGIEFEFEPQVNQIFPVMANTLIDSLREKYGFYDWKKIDDSKTMVRLVCSWATENEMIESFVEDVKRLLS